MREQSKHSHRTGHAPLHFLSCWLRKGTSGWLSSLWDCCLWSAGDLGFERRVSSFVMRAWKRLLLTQNLSKEQSNNGSKRIVGVALLSNAEMLSAVMMDAIAKANQNSQEGKSQSVSLFYLLDSINKSTGHKSKPFTSDILASAHTYTRKTLYKTRDMISPNIFGT